jgi:hypothetical protein
MSVIEFKAGRMTYKDGGRWLEPETTKGLVQLVNDDGLRHFRFVDRSSRSVLEVSSRLITSFASK